MAITSDIIEPIISEIKERREQEIEKNVPYPAFSRLDAFWDGGKETFWIVLSWNSSNDVIDNGGRIVTRDSRLGGLLIQKHQGKYSYTAPGGVFEIDIINKVRYTPTQGYDGFANRISVNLSGDSFTYQYGDLIDMFEKLSLLKNEIEKAKDELVKDKSEEIEEKLKELETDQQYYLNNAQAFIRQNAELRWQPALDPDQDLIKRSKIFDSGTLIINGGPGTGKTTSLIQRIKFLISSTIEEYKPLTKAQKELLSNGNSSWIFYSPSDLLALYLKDNMAKEELAADTRKVRVWKKHRSELIKLYRLYDADSKGKPKPNSFLFYSSNETFIYSTKTECIKKIIEDFTNYFFVSQKDKILKINDIPDENFIPIIKITKEERERLSSKEYDEEYKKRSLLAARSIKNYIKSNSDFKYFYQLVPVFYYLNENYKGDFAVSLFNDIPKVYKEFRKEQLDKNDYYCWDIELLNIIVKDKNQKLHSDEQSFLLYFINTICYEIAQNLQFYSDIKHPYIDAYKNNCKPVIAIDEATDFSLLDLLAMNSLRHPLFSSVTLSGDLMQRMTTEGLKSWQDYSDIQVSTEVKDLTKSYRQSPTLLTLAQTIYQKSTGEKATYISYMEPDPLEPKPLMKISEENDEKVKWISERILEISRIYMDSVGNIPSIAVFVPNEDDIDVFADELNNILLGNIPVSPCKNGKVLGEASEIRVFAIDKIKGLEFEAAFFHNLDNLSNINEDLLLKYLYVGLSRATFYLGVTLTKELNRVGGYPLLE
jgi:hypothetical protein